MGSKVATTLTIDSEVKRDFKLECVLNEVEMSETVEGMMSDYVELSRQMRKQREEKNGKTEQ